MGKYEWNLEQIQSSISNEDKVNALAAEISNTRDTKTYDLFDRHDSFKDFKSMYLSDCNLLGILSPVLRSYIINLYKKANIQDVFTTVLPHHELSDDELISYVYDFFKYINDPVILKEIEYIINPDNHILRIGKHSSNDINNVVQGRVIKENDSKDAFGSFYKKGNDEDIVILTHEIGHILSHRLFYDNINPIVSDYLTEVESYLFELLMGYYLGNEYDMVKLSLLFRSNRLAKIVDYIWDIRVMDIISKQLFGINYSKLNKTLKMDSYPADITADNIHEFTRVPLFYKSKMINSYMVAYELFLRFIKDKEYGLHSYRSLFTSKEVDYLRLMDQNDIFYLQDDTNFNIMVDESKRLKKVLTKEY